MRDEAKRPGFEVFLAKTYCTGGTGTAQTIMAHTDIPLVSE